MTSDQELGAFLRARRDGRRPEEFGIDATPGRRRVPGLRREELAAAAGVSADYLRRVEQGSVVPSDAVLDALADALRLEPAQREHLWALTAGARGRVVAAEPPAPVSMTLRRTLEALLPTPAVVLGRCCEIVAWNRTGAWLDPVVAQLPPPRRSVARRVLLDPTSAELYPDWEALATEVTDVLRHNVTRFPEDTELRELVTELVGGSDLFRSRWDRHEIFRKTNGRKLIDHPHVGRLELEYESFDVTRAPGQVLIVYTAPAAGATAARLQRLAALGEPGD